MKRNQFFAICMVLLMLFTVGCGASKEASAYDMAPSAPMASAPAGGVAMKEEWAADAELPMVQETVTNKTENSVYQNSGAKLIRRAEVSIQTTEFDQAVQSLDQLVVQYGGYYESATVYGGSYRNAHANRSGEYVVRIPAEQFTAFRSSTGELGYVTRSTESSEDVGEKYYDAEARLKTQRTKQERLLKLLEQAATMEDIIDLENALSDVEYEIEQLSSTLNRYDALIGYSTFLIYLNEVQDVTEEVGETASLWQRMSAGFASSGKGLVQGAQNMLVWFAYNIFGLAIFGVAAVVGVIIVSKKVKGIVRKRRNVKNDQAE